MVCNTFLIFLYKFLHIFLVTADFICVIMTVVWHFVYKLPFNNESEEILMKRLQVLFLVALSSSLLLFGCGKKEEETATQPIVEPIVEAQPQEEEET